MQINLSDKTKKLLEEFDKRESEYNAINGEQPINNISTPAAETPYSDLINTQLIKEQEQRNNLASLYQGEQQPDYLLNNVYNRTQKRIENYEQQRKNMFSQEGTDYDTDYDQYNTQEQKYIKPYGDLSKRWQEAGGAVKYDKYGKPTLDIEKQRQLSKENPNIPDPITLLRFSLPNGGFNKKDTEQFLKDKEEIYKNGKKIELKNVKSIDTSYLTPDERKELDKHKDELTDAGIIGQNVVEYNKKRKDLEPLEEKNEGVKYLVRGATKVLDTVGSFIRRAIAGEDVSSYKNIGKSAEEIGEKFGEETAADSEPITKEYDKYAGTYEPKTAKGRILQNIGEFLSIPIGGTGVKVLKSAIGGSLGTEGAEQLYDWAALSEEEKQQQLKEKPGLAKLVVGLAGGILGDAGIHALTDGLKIKINKKDYTEVKALQQKFAKGDFEKQIYDDTRQEIVNKLEKELYKQKSIFEDATDLPKDVQTAEVMFKRSVDSRDKEKVKEIFEKYNNGEKIEIKPTSFAIKQDPELLDKINSFLAKTRNGAQERDLLESVTDETVTPFKEHIQTLSKQAGEAYENQVKDLNGIEIDNIKALETVGKNVKNNVASPEQEKISEYYTHRLAEAKDAKDLINLNREINQDIYSAPNDGVKYTLNQIKEGIKQYFKEESKENENFQKILEANEQYSVAKKVIDERRAILDKLHGERDRYHQAENRKLEKSSVAYEKYKNLTPEEQKTLLENSTPETADTFRKINLSTIKTEDFGKYSDIELQNAFGQNWQQAKEYSQALASFPNGATQSHVMQQALEEFRTGNISQKELEDISTLFKKGVSVEGQKELDTLINQAIKEQQLFKQYKFIKPLREGKIDATAGLIKDTSDLKVLKTMQENLKNTFKGDSKRIDDFIDGVYKIKRNEFTEEINKLYEGDKLNYEKIGDYFTKNKEYISELFENNKNINHNLQVFTEEFLPETKKLLEQAKETAKKMTEQCEEWTRYKKMEQGLQDTINKTEKKFFNEEDLNRSFIAQILSGNLFHTLLLHSTIYYSRKAVKVFASKKLTKLREDPKYFQEKILKQKKDYKQSLELAQSIFKTLSKKFSREGVLQNTVVSALNNNSE